MPDVFETAQQSSDFIYQKGRLPDGRRVSGFEKELTKAENGKDVVAMISGLQARGLDLNAPKLNKEDLSPFAQVASRTNAQTAQAIFDLGVRPHRNEAVSDMINLTRERAPEAISADFEALSEMGVKLQEPRTEASRLARRLRVPARSDGGKEWAGKVIASAMNKGVADFSRTSLLSSSPARALRADINRCANAGDFLGARADEGLFKVLEKAEQDSAHRNAQAAKAGRVAESHARMGDFSTARRLQGEGNVPTLPVQEPEGRMERVKAAAARKLERMGLASASQVAKAPPVKGAELDSR